MRLSVRTNSKSIAAAVAVVLLAGCQSTAKVATDPPLPSNITIGLEISEPPRPGQLNAGEIRSRVSGITAEVSNLRTRVTATGITPMFLNPRADRTREKTGGYRDIAFYRLYFGPDGKGRLGRIFGDDVDMFWGVSENGRICLLTHPNTKIDLNTCYFAYEDPSTEGSVVLLGPRDFFQRPRSHVSELFFAGSNDTKEINIRLSRFSAGDKSEHEDIDDIHSYLDSDLNKIFIPPPEFGLGNVDKNWIGYTVK